MDKLDRFYYFRDRELGFGWGVRDSETNSVVAMVNDKNDAAMFAWFLSRNPRGEELRETMYPDDTKGAG